MSAVNTINALERLCLIRFARLGYDNPMKIEDTIINPNAIPAIGAPGTPNHVPGYPTAGILWRVTAVSNEGFIAHPWGEPESSRAFTNSQAKWFNAWDEPNDQAQTPRERNANDQKPTVTDAH